MQPSTLRGRLEGEILVSKVWEWEVWCCAIWGAGAGGGGAVSCKRKMGLESVMMLFCVSKGDEIEGWKERREDA